MNLCCPGCGLKGPLESFAADKDARHVAALMGKVPPALAELVLRYLGLFAPPKNAVTWGKARRLLEELVPMIAAGRIKRAKREWTVSLAQWEEGLQLVVERRGQLTLPLKGHGYLLEVLAGAANGVEARAEAQGIERVAQGERGQLQAEPVAAGAALDTGRLEAFRCLQQLQRLRATNKKLSVTASEEELRRHLAGMGFGAAAIDHALKQPEPQQP